MCAIFLANFPIICSFCSHLNSTTYRPHPSNSPSFLNTIACNSFLHTHYPLAQIPQARNTTNSPPISSLPLSFRLSFHQIPFLSHILHTPGYLSPFRTNPSVAHWPPSYNRSPVIRQRVCNLSCLLSHHLLILHPSQFHHVQHAHIQSTNISTTTRSPFLSHFSSNISPPLSSRLLFHPIVFHSRILHTLCHFSPPSLFAQKICMIRCRLLCAWGHSPC